MKKSLFLFVMLFCALTCFTSCSSDDDDNSASATNVVGTYDGPLGLTINGTSLGEPISYPIVITSTDDSTIALKIADFKLGTQSLGDFMIKGCNCTYANGTYTLKGETTVSVTLAGAAVPCPTTIKGSISNSKATLTITITVPGLNQTVVVSYTGTKKAV